MHQPGVPIIPFDWSEYLSLAKELIVDVTLVCSQEAKLRSGISRAYYAVYHKAENLVFPAGPPNKWGSHRQVIDELQSSDDPLRRGFGVELERLRGSRTKADYQDTLRNIPREAQDALIAAEELIAGLNGL
jgi:uncharacterized protein (UPF0332 family)